MTVDLSPEASSRRRVATSAAKLADAREAFAALERIAARNAAAGGPRGLPKASAAKRARQASRSARRKNR